MSQLLRLRYWLLAATTFFAALVGGTYYGRGMFFLVFAFGVLMFIINLFWSSLLSLTGEAPLTLEEALGMAAPSTEEERKTAVLRALKDLEYERTVGKISDEDYRELSTKYRIEAKALLQLVEGQMLARRTRAEALVSERLAREGIAVSSVHSDTVQSKESTNSAATSNDAAPNSAKKAVSAQSETGS